MPDDAPKPEPIKFPVVVTVNSVRVEVMEFSEPTPRLKIKRECPAIE
jgi:hypothetical protein